MSNIVFFGQADAGKSTLAGYLISKFDSHFKLSRFIESMKRNNTGYNTRLVFSSIINTNRDETEVANKLNSKSLHLRKINMPFDSVTIIDTPGSESYRAQRERGMYYGNIGIFFMEINNLLELKKDTVALAPIALWSKLENKRMIFLLTKFDMVNYNKEKYEQALNKVTEICSNFEFDGKVTVIPTAIEVDRIKYLTEAELDEVDLGENICSPSQKMPWYDGHPVVDTIEAEINELDQRDEKEPLMFCITDQIDRPDSHTGKVWNINVLSGLLRVGQEICLAPVKNSSGNYSVLTAEIKQLRSDLSRFDNLEDVTIARKGEMYGMDLKKCYIDGHYAKKSDFNAVSSSCGFSANSQFLMSDCFSFEICEKDIDGFKEGRQMKLMWFGRSLSFIVDTIIVSTKITIWGKLLNKQICLPLSGKAFRQSILIKGIGEKDFYNCALINIGERIYNKEKFIGEAKTIS